MFVLGIDPGLTRCGYGAIVAGRPPRAAAIGVLRTDRADPLERRLADLADDVAALLDELTPDVVAVERIFFQVNASTAMPVAQALGVVLAEVGRRGVEVAEYSPNEIKLAVAGHGGADKQQVQRMVQTRLDLPMLPSPADAADGAAVALCHLASAGARRRRALAVERAVR